ncbi:MAG TPA: endonuclease/exonuclease/phosphatase family protein [Gemmatimonadales bacterium]|jgi:endonuclease/exonuclease/phosphatase family metal-dependent hydrolase|nr:endonuclease/exonuclease/phosphatase family protein [Gemmatimonadales bacterium]
MRARRPLLIAALVLAGACSDQSDAPFGAEAMDPTSVHPGSVDLAVMTRNLYVGADVDAVIAALASSDPADDIPALLAAVATLGATDFPARASAVADEIARFHPHAVGLQEVSTVDLTIPPLGVDLHLDFLPALQAELAERGLTYDVAARVRNIEATPLPGVSLLDEDVMLIDRSRVTVQNAAGAHFTANLGQVAPGVVLQRGYVRANVLIGGEAYVIASTHLESGAAAGLDQLRALQAGELARALASAPSAIVMGDLNDGPGSPMHQIFEGAGFTDAWAALRPGVVGLTCCHLADLSDQIAPFSQRIDYVFVRGVTRQGNVQGRIWETGVLPADRIAGPEHPIWPSDHAGLVARLNLTSAD